MELAEQPAAATNLGPYHNCCPKTRSLFWTSVGLATANSREPVLRSEGAISSIYILEDLEGIQSPSPIHLLNHPLECPMFENIECLPILRLGLETEMNV